MPVPTGPFGSPAGATSRRSRTDIKPALPYICWLAATLEAKAWQLLRFDQVDVRAGQGSRRLGDLVCGVSACIECKELDAPADGSAVLGPQGR